MSTPVPLARREHRPDTPDTSPELSAATNAQRTASTASADLVNAERAWREQTHAPHIARQGERQAEFTTQALHWPVEPLYTPLDLERAGFDYLQDLGFPGQYPYTRGTEPNGHRTRLWTMAQVTGFGRGQDWAKRARFMLCLLYTSP